MEYDLKQLGACFDKEARNFSGYFGLAAQHLDRPSPILFHGDELFPTASVIKLVIVVEYLAQVAAGLLRPDQPVEVQARNQVGGSGVLKDLQPGLRVTLQDIATLAITVSDNTAANLLIEQVGGLEQINQRLQGLEMDRTRMGRPFIFEPDLADNIGTPVEFLRLLLAAARDQLINPAVSRQLIAMMRRQQYQLYGPRYLPYHPFAAEYGLPHEVTIANKVGMLRGTVNEAAIITTPDFSYGLVIFSRDCTDFRADPDNEGALLVARLSRRVYDYFAAARR